VGTSFTTRPHAGAICRVILANFSSGVIPATEYDPPPNSTVSLFSRRAAPN
jgi:hypothetical protein